MAQKLTLAAAAVVTGVGAKAAALPTPFAGCLAAAVFFVGVGVSSFLKVDVPKVQTKAKKLSKKEKRAIAAANEPEPEVEVEDAAKVAKAAKKRAKERAKKEAKRAAAEEERVATAKAEKEAVVVEEKEKELTKAEKAKKKKKDKAKAKKAAQKAPETKPTETRPTETKEEKIAEPLATDDWEEVKVKKSKKKVEVDHDTNEPEYNINLFVERKFFGNIIGPGGSYLRSITEATGTNIELPKEGGMRHEILISGTEKGCAKAESAIKQLVGRGYSDLTHQGTVDKTVAIPDNKRGLVIGQRGMNIRVLQDKLGVKINFPERGSQDDVSVVGDEKSVKEALAAIKQLIEEGYSSVTHENFVKAEIEVARDMLKNLIGPGGATIKGLQKSTGVQINIPSDNRGETSFVTLLGEPGDVAECRAKMAELLVAPEPTPIPEEWSKAASLQHLDQW